MIGLIALLLVLDLEIFALIVAAIAIGFPLAVKMAELDVQLFYHSPWLIILIAASALILYLF
jgi:hypothetical protein